MKAHYKRGKWKRDREKAHFVRDEFFDLVSDSNSNINSSNENDILGILEDLEDDLYDEEYNPSHTSETEYSTNTSINKSKSFKVCIVIVVSIFLLSSPILYLRCLNSIAMKNLSTAYSSYIDSPNFIVNGESLSLDSVLLSIREISDLEDLSFMDKIIGSKKSDVISFVNALSNNKVNFCKVGNLILFEKSDDAYSVLSSDKIKVRYSDFKDGYLLEINNKFNDEFYLYYSSDGVVSEKSNEGLSDRTLVRSGLTQVFIPSTYDINTLCNNLIKLKN